MPVEQAVERGHVAFWLEERKLAGGFALTRIGTGRQERWLVVKMADDAVDAEHDPVRQRPESVKSRSHHRRARTRLRVTGASGRSTRPARGAAPRVRGW